MKYIIYCRKSTDTEDKQLLSLLSQQTVLEEIAEANNLNVAEILTESMSAKEPGRPIFNNMMQMIKSGKADAILCWKIDRLTRNPVDGGQIQWALQQGDIKCITTSEKTYLPNDNVLIMSIEQAMANQYIRELSANVKRGNKTKLQQGGWPSPAPIGYLNDRIEKTIIPDPERAPYIKKVFEIYATGSYSLRDITATLYNKGFRTKNGKKVAKSGIRSILSRNFYIGLMLSNGIVYQGNHKPIVSKKLYDEVQNVLTGTTRPRPKNLFFPMRGFLSCEVCGCSLTASLKKGHHYYYCTNGKGVCNEHKKYLRENDVYEMVASLFDELHFSERKIELMYKAAKVKAESESRNENQIVENLEHLLQLQGKKESLLLDTLLAEQISQDLYKRKVSEITQEQISLKKQIKTAKRKSPLTTLEPTKKVFLTASRARFEFLNANDKQKRTIVEKLLWNLSVQDNNMAQVKYKSPYQVLAKAPKNVSLSTLLPDQGSNLD